MSWCASSSPTCYPCKTRHRSSCGSWLAGLAQPASAPANYDNAPHLSTFKGNDVRIVLRWQLKHLQNQFALSIGHRTGNLR
jgi:hypothetical protein